MCSPKVLGVCTVFVLTVALQMPPTCTSWSACLCLPHLGGWCCSSPWCLSEGGGSWLTWLLGQFPYSPHPLTFPASICSSAVLLSPFSWELLFPRPGSYQVALPPAPSPVHSLHFFLKYRADHAIPLLKPCVLYMHCIPVLTSLQKF